ncbi:MAG: hypothetical protein ABL957_05245 [Parvularculaceae bacterium]
MTAQNADIFDNRDIDDVIYRRPRTVLHLSDKGRDAWIAYIARIKHFWARAVARVCS